VSRARFKPEEVVRLTIDFYKRNYIEGLFLSSGIIQSADYTMEQMILVAKKLREEENFGGYIHLKAVPGASEELLLEAGKYADRLSANLEMPVQKDLDSFAPDKTIQEIEDTMVQIQNGIEDAKDLTTRAGEQPKFAPAGQSTQLVIGATETSDATILRKSEILYKAFGLRRVYYSAFSPIPDSDSRLPAQAAPLLREHRLYQSDWLMRNYEFEATEILDKNQNLDLEKDPKLAWALKHRDFFPIDVNLASARDLLRVPGLGARNVSRILKIRRHHALRLEDLAKLRVIVNRAKWFVTTADHNPNVFRLDAQNLEEKLKPKAQQLSLFADFNEAGISALNGQL
jgi:putative DNA modification/repair radical SAM protein